MHIITLTTDFGTRDWFVGTMKGVLLGINPRAAIVDITHQIPPGDIRAGAFALMAGCRYFPKGTVHVAVVDPGVGSQRRAIAVNTTDYFFVGPDNGVLSWALTREKIKTIRRLENPKYFRKPISRTFHGRDIFAPVAAYLSRGASLKQFGRELTDFVRLPWPKPTKHPGEIRGEIMQIDHFGNAITNIEGERVSGGRNITCEAIGKRKVRCTLAEFYGAVRVNSAVAVMGSSGFLEIAVNGGSAANRFGLTTGDAVIVRAN
ncbi:MAG TPA: SAM-dependent chlorinase/fluorinase [Verrucomicrobiae bacterium]|nr:SAM-dependent chlorinase/fluorinase [Verrucomicrobiae bacterium]